MIFIRKSKRLCSTRNYCTLINFPFLYDVWHLVFKLQLTSYGQRNWLSTVGTHDLILERKVYLSEDSVVNYLLGYVCVNGIKVIEFWI
jgi:hypothetical protein